MVALACEPLVANLSLPMAAGTGIWPYFEFTGVLHPAVSHFPIALLTVAGFVEAWSVLRREKKPANVTLVCLSIGTASAVLAAVLGWADADRMGYSDGETINRHRWLGVAVAVFSVLAFALSMVVRRANVGRTVIWIYRANVFATAALVGLVGSLGGKLVHGSAYYDDAWADLAQATTEKAVGVAMAAADESVDLAQGVVKGAADAIKSVPAAVQPGSEAGGTRSTAPTTGPTTGPAASPEAVVATQPNGPAATQPAVVPVAGAAGARVGGAEFGGGRVDYVRDILPIFEARCLKCHDDKKQKGDYRMDAIEHLFAAGETGETPILPGRSDESLFVKLIEGKGEYEDLIMPPKGDPLTLQQIALIRRWIDEGAHPKAQ